MKIRKNISLLAIIVSLLLTVSLIQPSLAGTTTLTAPEISDDTKTPGSTVSINIGITDAVNLWGYMFTLKYDTTVLTATGYSSHPIFGLQEPCEINDEEGYVSIAYHMDFGVPAGFTGSLPNLASIQFTVDDYGAAQLNIEGSVLSDPFGNPIAHVAVDGSFRNVEGMPLADFYWTPETPTIKETVTFTSTTSDPDGTIVSWDWDFGDRHSGTGETATHAYGKEGTYTVTLTVTDDEGNTDSFSQTITVLPKPFPTGATLLKVECTQHLLDFSQYGVKKTILKAWVENLNTKEKTLVRVVFMVYDAGAMQNLGALEDITWMGPNSVDMFAVDFWYPDWGFTGPEMEYLIVVKLFYMDYYITPEQPHWEEVPEEGYTSFWVIEQAPVLVYTWTDLGDGSVFLDASASYDPDEKWGDYIIDYTWRVYDIAYPYSIFSGVTATHILDPDWADAYWQDEAGNWYGDYYCMLYITDSLYATVMEDFYISIYLPGYVP